MINDIETLRVRATDLGIRFSGNTGAATLAKKIDKHTAPLSSVEAAAKAADFLGDNEPLPELTPAPKVKAPPSLAELQVMDLRTINPANQALVRQIVRSKALVLRRVSIVNLDPSDAELSGAVITVMNKYTGKVSKYIPFGEGSQNGYHVPQIILNHLLDQKFVMRKANKGGHFGVKTYKTSLVPKYNITILPDLTKDELKNLANRQAASQSIGNDDD